MFDKCLFVSHQTQRLSETGTGTRHHFAFKISHIDTNWCLFSSHPNGTPFRSSQVLAAGIINMCCSSNLQSLTPSPLKMLCKRPCKWTVVFHVVLVLAFTAWPSSDCRGLDEQCQNGGAWFWEMAGNVCRHAIFSLSSFKILVIQPKAWLIGSLESWRSHPASAAQL